MGTFDGCDPGANPWVEKYFHDCVHDYRDAVGFTLGLCSILVWLTAQLPQFVSNMKNQSSEALSIWFLVEWFAGDTLNLLGCLIQGQQLPTTTILAAYFVLMDVIMLLQYIYYGALQARRKRLREKAFRRRHSHRHASSTAHRHGRDESHQEVAVHLLQDGGVDDDSNPDSSALVTPAGDSSDPSGSRSRSNLRTLTAAAAAGVSVVCVATLTLHPSSGSPGAASAGRHLLSLSGNQPGHAAAALLAGGSDASGGISSAGAGASLAAAGVALSAVGRSLATVLHPAVLLGAVGGDGAGDSSSSGDDAAGSSSGCSFLNCDVALVAGTAMGYLSTCFYLASRISQIRKNLARRSTEGLSPFMFMLTMCANLCTGVSIVVRLRSLEELKEQLPWMCGTFGTIALDMTLFYQAMTLGQAEHHHAHSHSHGGGGLGAGHDPHHHGQGHGAGHGGHGHGGHGGCCGSAGGAAGRVVEAEALVGGKLSDLEAPLLAPPSADDSDAVAVNGGGAAAARVCCRE